jgi:hypothetical protein
LDWFRKAAAQGEFSAQAWLGWIYLQGLGGVSQDHTEAAKWFQKAAEQDYAYAQAWLGVMYALGQGVSQDYGKAADLLQRAAEQGDPTAQAWLGWLYEKGHGVTQDHAEARTWYEKAAAQGLAEAKTALARLGPGVGVGDVRLAPTETVIVDMWRGNVVQPGSRPYSIIMQITVPNSPQTCGAVDYPELGCSGELYDCKQQGDGSYRMLERINRGWTCVVGGSIQLRPSGDSLAWAWFYPDGRPGATATLSRQEAWHQTTAGCSWWGRVGSGDSNIKWTGECRDGLIHGEGRLEWHDSAGQRQSGPPLVVYRGLPVHVKFVLAPTFEMATKNQCLDLMEGSNAVIEPVDPGFLHHFSLSMSRMLPHELQAYNTRLISYLTVGKYQFKVAVAFSADDWCSPARDTIVVTTDAEISEPDLLYSSLVREVFDKSIQITDVIWPRPRARTGVLLIGKQSSSYRVIAAGRAESIMNYVLEEHNKTESKRKFDQFNEQNQIVIWPQVDVLVSNPFQYEDQVVGIRAAFVKMRDRSTALFMGADMALLVVEGVPSILFSGGEDVLLAGRVKGLAEGVVNLEYVAAHVCADPQCSDLLSWRERAEFGVFGR